MNATRARGFGFSLRTGLPAESGPARPSEHQAIGIEIERLKVWYGREPVLRDISLGIARQRITALIGPSGCGKSTLLRCINRLTELVEGCRIEGSIRIDGREIHGPDIDLSEHRRRVGMVFQKPNPFPRSVFENVAFGLRLAGLRDRRRLADRVEQALRDAALWDEVKDRLDDNALSLSGGQQQRLVIARAIAIEPEVLLLDEPCSALDPISTARIEELLVELSSRYTILIVTHNMQQAARVSDYTAYLYMGELIEFADTAELFTNPRRKATEDYITGRHG